MTLASPASGPARNKRLLSEPPRLWGLVQRPRRLTHHREHKGRDPAAVGSSSCTVASLAAFLGGKEQRCVRAGDSLHRGQKGNHGNRGGSLAQGWAAGRRAEQFRVWAAGTGKPAAGPPPAGSRGSPPAVAGAEDHTLRASSSRASPQFWKPQSKVRLAGPDSGGGQGWLPLKAPGKSPPCLFRLLGAAGALGWWPRPPISSSSSRGPSPVLIPVEGP